MKKSQAVSVNILTYNAQDLIGPCLRAVFEQSYPNIEILIVDNASEDKTISKIKNLELRIKNKFPFRVIKNKKNLGYTGGHNVGIRKSRGEYVLCLTQDVVLDKDFIKNSVKAIEKHDNIGSIQGKFYKIKDINNPEKDIIDNTGLLMFKNRRVVSRGLGEKDRGQHNKTEEIFGVDGAAPLYRRKALEDIKIDNEYFDEDLFMYKEDIDMAWRLRLYGWRAIYEPTVIAYHLRSAGERAVKDYISVALARTKISRFAKFYSFKNDRLIRIKNELPSLFFRHIFYILIKEIGAWAYVLIFEHYTWKAIIALFKQIPNTWRKRKIIMAKRRIGAKEMRKWFV